MRGKDLLVVQPCTADGITPAYAGKSLISSSMSDSLWDHPRLCGEKISFHSCSFRFAGSPPPMRGKVLFCLYRLQYNGITPAYAGKSVRIQPHNDSIKDHPRLCGEKKFENYGKE